MSTALDPGGATTVNKVVHTATVPPKPDVVFLADTTGSMATAIANVKANVLNVISGIRSSQPQAQSAPPSTRTASTAAPRTRTTSSSTRH